ncbi:DUF285 domain-containing protein, partial [Campylobacter coli]|nr:DUF285 domain-containing protein [Campylobacter coli]
MQDLDSQLLKAIDDLRKSNVSEWEAKKAVVLELFDKGASIPQDTLDKLEVYLSDLEQEYWDDKAVYAGRSIKDSDEYDLFNILSRLNAAKSKKKSLDGLFKITKSKGVRHTPKNKNELVKLVKNRNIYLGDIDISNITNFKNLFKKSKRKDFGGIETWDVSKVTNMDSCFEDAKYFNHNIQSWNVSKVKSMENMFYGCENFNQPLDKWDVGKVTNMSSMFEGCKNFNGDLSKWDVGNVTNMERMFLLCEKFNGDLSKWDVSNVENMSFMFEGCKKLTKWDISNVTSKITKSKGIRHTPKDKAELVELVEDKRIYLGDIDISNITNFRNLFKKSKRRDFGGIETWDVSKVTNMDSCFEDAKYFNHNIQSWNVSKVKSMKGMFYGCENFNQPLDKWNVSKVKSMESMFHGCENFNQSLDKWNVSKVKSMESMFHGC